MGKGQTECDAIVLSSTETIVTLKASLCFTATKSDFSAGNIILYTCIAFSYLYKFYYSWHAIKL